MNENNQDSYNRNEEWQRHWGYRRGMCKSGIFRVILFLVAILLIVKIGNNVKTFNTIGRGIVPQNVIVVTGTGDAYSTPDIAEITFDVTNEASTVAQAQQNVTDKMNDILAYLKSAGVDDKDVKTVNYNIYPRYEYKTTPIVCPPGSMCPNIINGGLGQRTLAGYDVTHSIDVKVRKIEDASKILAVLGSKNVTNLSGINFTNEDPNAAQAQARDKAIADAKSKAQKLADSLGVSLVGVVSFSEGGNYPIYYGKTMASDSMAIGGAPAAAPMLPAGQNKVTSNVTITYEIH
jgi:uncharacterized protein YggE